MQVASVALYASPGAHNSARRTPTMQFAYIDDPLGQQLPIGHDWQSDCADWPVRALNVPLMHLM